MLSPIIEDWKSLELFLGILCSYNTWCVKTDLRKRRNGKPFLHHHVSIFQEFRSVSVCINFVASKFLIPILIQCKNSFKCDKTILPAIFSLTSLELVILCSLEDQGLSCHVTEKVRPSHTNLSQQILHIY